MKHARWIVLTVFVSFVATLVTVFATTAPRRICTTTAPNGFILPYATTEPRIDGQVFLPGNQFTASSASVGMYRSGTPVAGQVFAFGVYKFVGATPQATKVSQSAFYSTTMVPTIGFTAARTPTNWLELPITPFPVATTDVIGVFVYVTPKTTASLSGNVHNVHDGGFSSPALCVQGKYQMYLHPDGASDVTSGDSLFSSVNEELTPTPTPRPTTLSGWTGATGIWIILLGGILVGVGLLMRARTSLPIILVFVVFGILLAVASGFIPTWVVLLIVSLAFVFVFVKLVSRGGSDNG